MTTRDCHHDTTWSHVDGDTICDACEEVVYFPIIETHIPGAHEDGVCYCSTPLEDRPHHPCSVCGNPVPIGEYICSCRLRTEHVPIDQL